MGTVRVIRYDIGRHSMVHGVLMDTFREATFMIVYHT
jgi:hypothetical protein